MNNKAFTLVEVLAVIVVIAIILTIGVPKIGSVVDDSRRNTFLGEAQSVYRAAKIKALDLANTGDGGVINSKGNNKLDMRGNSLDYCVIVDEEGSITSITVSNGKYLVTGGADFTSLGVDSVTLGNMDSFTCE